VGGFNLAANGFGGGGGSGSGSGGGEGFGDSAALTVPEGLSRPNWCTTGVGEGLEGLTSQWGAVRRVAVALMREYESRINGSVLREYGSFVAWDFRAVDAEWAGSQARFLAADLEAAIREGGEGFERDVALANVAITMRKTRVEVSLRYWNKGRLARDILARAGGGVDFVLAIGDDATDEDCFAAVAGWREGQAAPGVKGCAVFPVTVGRKLAADTKATSYLGDVAAVHALLNLLARAARGEQ
jgi:trehalose-phosphatase